MRVSADWIVSVDAPPVRNGTLELPGDGEVRARIVTRGLCNAHVHLELSALRGRAPGGVGFLPWVTQMLAERKALGRDALVAAIPHAIAEAQRFGTAAVGDITNTLDAVPAMAAAGLRGIVFHELLEKDDIEKGGDAIAWALATRDALGGWPSRLAYSIAPHAPYSVSGAMLGRILESTPDGVPMTIHAAEDREELALLRDGSGPWPKILRAMGVWDRSGWIPERSPVQHLDAVGFLARRPPPLLVHMVHATPAEIALATDRDATIVLCPRSNLHIGGRLPDVTSMVDAGVRLALGTDSLSSNETLSVWSEMATLSRHFPDLAPETWVRAATVGGAEALGLRPDELGWIAVDAAGDDPYAALASAEPQEVRWLWRA